MVVNEPERIEGRDIAELLHKLDVSHVIWLPDSEIGLWESSLANDLQFDLVRVCREGEAWPLAAGLMLAGSRPIVMMQCTGLFESGDALRNVVYDLALPVYALIGVRNGRDANSKDSAKRFVRPIVQSWEISTADVSTRRDLPNVAQHYQSCQADRTAGFALLNE